MENKKSNIRYNPFEHAGSEEMAQMILDVFPPEMKSPDGTSRIPSPAKVQARRDRDRPAPEALIETGVAFA